MLVSEGLFLLLATLEAIALDCSRPPESWGGKNYANYSSWCRACGGTPYSNNGVGCNPGPNWGGKASGGGGAVGGGLSSQQQFMLQGAQTMIGIFQQMEAENEARRQQEAALAAERARIAAEQARIEADRRHAELGSRLQGRESGGKLSLLRDGDSGAPRLLREESQSRPIEAPIDCKQTRAVHDRMAGGLEAQREAIRRTETQLTEAGKDQSEATKKMAMGAANLAIDEFGTAAKLMPKQINAMSDRVKKLLAAGKISPEKAKEWGEKALKLREEAKALEKVYVKPAGAGKAYGDTLVNKTRTFNERLHDANNFLVDSGLAEEAAESMIKAAGSKVAWAAGPWGPLAFKLSVAGIDIGHAYGSRKLAGKEAEAAEKHLRIMKEQLRRSEDKISALQQRLMDRCAGQ